MLPELDDSLSRTYKDGRGGEIRLFLGFLGKQTAGRTLTSTNTDILHGRAEYLPTGLQPPWPPAVGVGRIASGGAGQVKLFWYQYPGVGTAAVMDAKLAAVKEALLAHRSGGMIVLVAAPASGSLGGDAGVPREFLDLVREHLPNFMPLKLKG